MVRIGLKVQRQPTGVCALAMEEADVQFFVASLALIALIGLAAGLEAFAARLVPIAFFAPGSRLIAKPVLALADAGILLGLYYLLGRLSMFLPARAVARDGHWSTVWRATEGRSAILFIVTIAVPCAVAIGMAGVMLWWVGALPWPGVDDFAGIESLGRAVTARLYVVVPVLFLSAIAAWSLAAAALCAAWESLDKLGAFEAGAAAS